MGLFPQIVVQFMQVTEWRDAMALLALNRLWGLRWPLERLLALGLTLGADVPFFLGGGDELSVAHGLSHATNWSVTMPGATGMEKIKGAMTSLRKEPLASLDGRL